MIRRTDGHIMRCTALSTLQKWIVYGEVSRNAEISLTGDKWKPLSGIEELESFFRIADEARAERETISESHSNLEVTGTTSSISGSLSTVPPGGRITAQGPSQLTPSSIEDSGGWSSSGVVPDQSEEEAGPTGGFSRTPSSDQVFSGNAGASATNGAQRTTTNEYPQSRYMSHNEDEADEIYVPRAGVAKWVALISILAAGGAFAFVYFNYLKVPARPSPPPELSDVASAQPEVAEAPPEPTSPPPNEPTIEEQDQAIERAKEARASDTGARLEASLAELNELRPSTSEPVGEKELRIAQAQAQTEIALAIVLLDKNRPYSKGVKNAKALALSKSTRARKIATEIVTAFPQNRSANVVIAEADRIAGKRAREVERRIRKGQNSSDSETETELARANLLIRDDREREARVILEAVENKQPADARARYQLAILDLKAGEKTAAKQRLESIFADHSEHSGATKLLADLGSELLETKPVVDTDTPMPPEAVTPPVKEPAPIPSEETTPTPETPASAPAETYDKLLDLGDSAAENGNCRSAIGYYKKALEKNPRGVSALTGLGDCETERSNNDEALSYYRAALSISRRYQPALWGVARTYETQGDKQNAIDAYTDFLREHPNSRKAAEAQRKIDLLSSP